MLHEVISRISSKTYTRTLKTDSINMEANPTENFPT